MRRTLPLLLPLALCLLLLCSLLPNAWGQDSSSSSTGEEVSSSSGPEESSSSSSSSTGASNSSTPVGPTTCVNDVMNIAPFNEAGQDYRCGCYRRVVRNVTNELNETSSVESLLNTYKSGKLWDRNAENDTVKWENTIDNAYSNRVDILNNMGVAPPTGTPFKEALLKTYPQCYGGANGNEQLLGTASNCFDQTDTPNEFFCEGTVGTPEFVKGNVAPPICLVYGGGNRLKKMRFYPKVDQFALLTIQSSFNSTTGFDQLGHYGTAFQVELNGFKSPVRHRYGSVQVEDQCVDAKDPANPNAPCIQVSKFTCIVVPFHTIVIRMNNGVISGLEWDDDDSLCGKDYSIDGNCGIDITTCKGADVYDKTNKAGATDCDFKIYVSWRGTDSQGTYLSSSERRLSQFRRWSLNAVYNQASQFDTGSLPTIPSGEE